MKLRARRRLESQSARGSSVLQEDHGSCEHLRVHFDQASSSETALADFTMCKTITTTIHNRDNDKPSNRLAFNSRRRSRCARGLRFSLFCVFANDVTRERIGGGTLERGVNGEQHSELVLNRRTQLRRRQGIHAKIDERVAARDR